MTEVPRPEQYRIPTSAPQPLRLKEGAFAFAGGNTVADLDPLLVARAMRVIAVSSQIDLAWANLLASLLSDPQERGTMVEVWTQLQSDGPRGAVLEVASRRLPPQDRTLISAVRTAIEPVLSRRNEFAHHLWVHISGRSDAVGLLNPASPLASLKEATSRSPIQITSVSDGAQTFLYLIDAQSAHAVRVFKAADLDRDGQAAELALGMVTLLGMLTGGILGADQARQRLREALQLA